MDNDRRAESPPAPWAFRWCARYARLVITVRDAIAAAAPDVVTDQLTWLPANPADIIKFMPNDTRVHQEGGGNLLAAAELLGVTWRDVRCPPLQAAASVRTGSG